jgi:23S rRNA (guanosine2251-2'-O)-methyltransferase
LDARAPLALQDLTLTNATILVVGSEHEGMSRGVRQTCSHLASLPTSGKLDSLNASVAAGIALSIVQINRSQNR